jgi:hypothetical protein
MRKHQPLIRSDRLVKALGVSELYIKSDTVNYSILWFEDRVVSVALSRARNSAFRLYPRSTLPEVQSHRSVKSWSKESRQSAIHDAYLDGTLPPGENATNATILLVGYTRHAKEIAERRIALAGYRLADEIRRTIR